MSRPIPDLVRDSRLETAFFGNTTQHVFYISDPARGRRRQRIEETWQKERRLGRGGFGTVWLERRIQGSNASRAEVRAVKEIQKPVGSDDDAVIDYTCELEAVAKFSHSKVGAGAVSACVTIHYDLLTLVYSINTALSALLGGTRASILSLLPWSI